MVVVEEEGEEEEEQDGPFLQSLDTLPLHRSSFKPTYTNMQLPFGRYIGLCTQQWEKTCKEYHRGGRGEGQGGD